MNIATLAAVLRERARLHAHDGWTRAELVAYQAQRLSELRDFAVLLAGARAVDRAAVTASLTQALERVGAVGVPVQVDVVFSIPRTALGKAPLVPRAAAVRGGH